MRPDGGSGRANTGRSVTHTDSNSSVTTTPAMSGPTRRFGVEMSGSSGPVRRAAAR
jgi:hypothetical protein